jgi:hypothetical protein
MDIQNAQWADSNKTNISGNSGMVAAELPIADDIGSIQSGPARRGFQKFVSGGGTIDDYETPPNNPVISFADFEGRFSTQEWIDATEFTYTSNATTGIPEQCALIQGIHRATSDGTVDLTAPSVDTLLGVLVTEGIITAEKKTTIMTP